MLKICRVTLYDTNSFVGHKLLVSFLESELKLFAFLLNFMKKHFIDVEDIGQTERQVDGESSPL
jgi:hypothetical protein